MNTNYLKLTKEVVIISVFIAVSLFFLAFKNVDYWLTNFNTLYISQATVQGVDVSARVSYFYKAMFGALLIIPLLIAGVNKLKVTLTIDKYTLEGLTVLSGLGLLSFFATLFGIDTQLGIALFAILLGVSIAVLFFNFKTIRFRLLVLRFPIVLAISIIVTSVLLILFNSTGIYNYSLLLLVMCIIILQIMFVVVTRFYSTTTRALVLFCMPIVTMPLLMFLAVELVFIIKFKYDVFIPYKWIIAIVTLAITTVIWTYNKRKNTSLSSVTLLTKLFFPAAILSFLLLTIYTPYINQPTDFFELANPANAQLRIFKFNEIPFVDFLSSHMFSEQFYGIIYHTIYGYSGNLGFVGYAFFQHVIFIFLVYWFLNWLFKNSFFAFVFILLFPFIPDLFSFHLFFGVGVFFFSLRLIKQQSIVNYLALALVILLTVLWRLDTGVASIIALAIYLPLLFYVSHQKINVNAIVKSGVVFLVLIIVGLIIFSILKTPHYLYTNMCNTLHYTAANQAHGYAALSYVYNQQFYMYYFLIPTVAVLCVLYILYRLMNDRQSLQLFTIRLLKASLFFFILFIANFQRGLVRHGFIENTEMFLVSTFYIALVLFLLSFYNSKSKGITYIVFVLLSFVCVVTLKYFPIDSGNSNLTNFLKTPTTAKLDSYFTPQNFKGKLIPNETFAKDNYLDFKTFLDTTITAEQTFLDFSNSPMLYFYCQRSVPSYFCQNLQNAIDDYLQLQQIKQCNPLNVPVVVYASSPISGFDELDGVPNPMRHYLIAAHIYKNYIPYKIINNKSVWISKALSAKITTIDNTQFTAKNYVYKHAAHAINEHFFTYKKGADLSLIKSLLDTPTIANDSLTVNLPLVIDTNVFVKITFISPDSIRDVAIKIKNATATIGTATFSITSTTNNYAMPLSNHFLWHNSSPSHLTLTNINKCTVSKIELYKYNVNEHTNTSNNR